MILFPQTGPPIDRGRLDDVRVQNASVGSPIYIVYGKNRVAGTIIWATGVRERKNNHSEGGKGGGGVSVTDYTYDTSLAILFCEGRIKKYHRIWANDQVIYDNRGGSATVPNWIDINKVRLYDGLQTLPDTAIEADKGVGNVPAEMGNGYGVLEDLQLDKVGNNVPNITAEVETEPWAGGTWTVELVLLDLAARAGIPSGKCDFSAMSSVNVDGLVVNARTEASRIMDTLSQVYWFDLVESGGILKAVPRTGVSILTIPASDIGADADKQTIKPYVKTTRVQEVDLPKEVQINYLPVGQDYQQFSQVSRRLTRHSQNQDATSFPMSLTDDYAKFLSDSRLIAQWTERDAHEFSLPYRYLYLDPGDVVTVPLEGGRSQAVRIMEMNAGLLAQIEFKAVTDNAIIYTDPHLPSASPPNTGTGGIGSSYNPVFFVGDINAPTDALAASPYLFFAAGSQATGWHGGTVQSDRYFPGSTGGIFFGAGTNLVTFSVASSIGQTDAGVEGALPDGPTGVIDRVNVVRVNMVSGALASVTEDEMVRQGKNMAVIGEEIIQFQTATLVLQGVYDLSGLIRGCRGTEYATASHASGDPFVLVDNFAKSFGYDASMRGQSSDFRFIESGNSYSGGYPSFDHATSLAAASRLPYSPVHLKAAGDRSGGSADVVLSWVRRARKNGALTDLQDVPLDESNEAYELEIWNSAGSSLLRTVTGLTSPTWTYISAYQGLDGVSASSFKFRVFQYTTDNGIGRGRGSEFLTVPLYPVF